jgi:cell division protein FtsB
LKMWIFLLFVMVLLAFWLLIHIGCGRDMNAENERLRAENNKLISEKDKLKLDITKLKEEIRGVADEQDAAIRSLSEENEALKKQVEDLRKEENEYSYNPLGKPDPFKPFIQLTPMRGPRAVLSPPPPPKLGPLFWNVWAEEGSEVKYNPVTHLKPRIKDSKPEYTIYIHLSNLNYEKEGFVTWKPGEKLRNLVDEQLRKLTEPSLTLKVILIPDSDYFAPPKKFVKDLTIDLIKIRKQLESLYISDNPLDVLRRQRTLPEFVFGSTFFEGIKTREKEGTGHIGLAIWHNGKPVEDQSLEFLISSSENKEVTPKLSSQAKQSLPLNLSLPPAAALHFFGLGDEKVVGIFWNNEKSEKFIIWEINRSPKEFYDYFETTLIPGFNKAKTPDQWRNIGFAFFNLLFPKAKGDLDVGSEFKKYVKKHIKEKPFENKDLPLLFVRFTENKEGLPFIIPLGLMAIDIEGGEKEFIKKFIGFHFKIEAPLKVERFLDKPKCITRWVISLPANDKDEKLKKAYKKIGDDVISTWKANVKKEDFFEDISSFGGWIEKREEDSTSTAIVVMSHHGKNVLSDSTGEVYSSNILRWFSQPSIAILNGCGTMEPGATDFIKQLNEGGITTVIATSTTVDALMAGDFLNCLGTEIEAKGIKEKKEITISELFVRTLECLYSKNTNYRTNILRYSLLGDGDQKLCLPKKEVEK